MSTDEVDKMEKRLEAMSMRNDSAEDFDKKLRMMDDRMNALTRRTCDNDEFGRKMKETEQRLRNNIKTNEPEL